MDILSATGMMLGFFVVVGALTGGAVVLGLWLFGNSPIGAFIGFITGMSILFGIAFAIDEQKKRDGK